MILVLLFHDTRSNDVRFMHKLAKHTYRKWNVHLENHTLQNNRSICRSMWTHFFPEMAWNLAVFFKLIKGFLKAYWISTLHCHVFFYLKTKTNWEQNLINQFIYLFMQLYLKTSAQVFHYEFCQILKNPYFIQVICRSNVSFQNCVPESIKMMRGLHKLILSTNKMVVAEKQDVHRWKETLFNFIWFLL